MKCNHCKEKIPRNEAKCPKCGAEIDEGYWAVKAYGRVAFIALLFSWVTYFLKFMYMEYPNVPVLLSESFGENKLIADFFMNAETPCMYIEAGGDPVFVLILLATLVALFNGKWNFILDIMVALPVFMYGYYLAFVAVCGMYGEYPRVHQLRSLLAFLLSLALACIAWIGGARIKAKKRAWRKKVRQITGRDDKELINCSKCKADLPKDAEVCPVCGKEVTIFDIDVPDNLAIWCSALAFKFRGAWSGWRKNVFTYTPGDYNLPEDTTRLPLFFGAAIPMVWSLVFSAICLCMAIDLGVPSDLWIYTLGKVNVPVYIFAVAACIAVFVFTFFLNRHIIKAINYKEWDKSVTTKLLISLGIRAGLVAVLVPCMLFLDVRVLLTIPLLAVLCISQILLLILSRAVRKHIKLYNEYAKDMIEKRNPESVTNKRYKNRKYMNMD